MTTDLVIFLSTVGFLAALVLLQRMFTRISRGQPLSEPAAGSGPTTSGGTRQSEWFFEARARTAEENAEIAASPQRRRDQSFVG